MEVRDAATDDELDERWPVGYGGLGTLSPAAVHGVDWSNPGTALTITHFSRQPT